VNRSNQFACQKWIAAVKATIRVPLRHANLAVWKMTGLAMIIAMKLQQKSGMVKTVQHKFAALEHHVAPLELS